MPLDPWERWLVIHGGELLPDGRPRFRKLLCIVARQNGKTHLLVVLSLFWLFVEQVSLVLGTSTNLDYAVESWNKAVQFVEDNPALKKRIPKNGVRRAIGQNTLTTLTKCRYKIAASNRKGGRSLTIKRLILDELREHESWDAWNASYLAMNAVRDAQAWAITNMGDETGVVLLSLRSELVDEDGDMRSLEDVDQRSGLFEWSAPKGSDAEDPEALAWANPNLNRHTDRGPFLEDLLAEARRAKRNGGEELAKFLTEILCLHVPALDPAVDKLRWNDCEEPGDLAGLANIALVLDVSLDERHVTLVAAALLADGRVRGKAVKAWSGPMCTAEALQDLPGIAGVIRPRKFGWLPNGPAASLAASLRGDWAPAGCELDEIKGEIAAVCMGLAEQVRTGQLVHSGDELLTAHVTEAQKLRQGDKWVFGRRGSGHCDGAYALAGAVHLARTMPPPEGRPRIRTM
ncbi:MAG: terminase [Acidimicrobiales bacterium]